jgi:hypothetical protein
MPNLLTLILFTILLIAIAAFGISLGMTLAARKYHEDLQREYRRGRKDGEAEARRVADLGKRTQPEFGQGYVSNSMKKAGL